MYVHGHKSRPQRVILSCWHVRNRLSTLDNTILVQFDTPLLPIYSNNLTSMKLSLSFSLSFLIPHIHIAEVLGVLMCYIAAGKKTGIKIW